MNLKAEPLSPRADAGVTLVEFALVVPIIVIILLGSLDLGWAVYTNNTLANSAREGARKSIISTTSPSAIRDHIRSVTAGLDIPDENIDISPETRIPGDPVTVTVTYEYIPFTPLIARFMSGGALTLTGKATMYVE